MISSYEIQNSLKTKILAQSIKIYDVVDSTNNVAKILAESGAPEGTTVIAEYQTSGRGRLQRKWYGEQGKSILLSIILRPREPEISRVMTFLAALDAAKVVEERIGISVECKWPNDLLIRGKKFCGILLESSWKQSAIEYLILGLGMNVNEEKFPSELRSTATSLKLEGGRELDRVEIIRSFLRDLEQDYLQFKQGDYLQILSTWASKCPMFGKEITVEHSGKRFTGKAVRLDPDGALVVEDHHREIKLFAADVTIVD